MRHGAGSHQRALADWACIHGAGISFHARNDGALAAHLAPQLINPAPCLADLNPEVPGLADATSAAATRSNSS